MSAGVGEGAPTALGCQEAGEKFEVTFDWINRLLIIYLL